MRHALFNRNNPPPMTLWQRRRAAAKRFGRNLVQAFQLSVQGFTYMLGREPVTAATLLVLVVQDQWAAMTAEAQPGEPVKAYVNFIVQIVIVIVAAIVAYAMAPKPPIPKPAALEDFDVPTAEEGRPVTKVFGEVWITSPNNLWYGDLSSEPIKKKGGKK